MFFPQPPDPTVHVFSDACGSFGCGGVLWNSHWFQLEWPPSWTSMDIVVKELVPIVVGSAIWGKLWYHKCVCFHTDNMAIVAILQNWSAKNTVAHHLLHCFHFYTAYFQYDYSVAYIPGVLNVAADALSRPIDTNGHIGSCCL